MENKMEPHNLPHELEREMAYSASQDPDLPILSRQMPISASRSNLRCISPEITVTTIQRPRESTTTSSNSNAKEAKKQKPQKNASLRPKGLTEARSDILKAFLLQTQDQPHRYGEIASETWIKELIFRLRKHNGSTGNVGISDVRIWLLLPDISVLVKQIRDASPMTRNAGGTGVASPQLLASSPTPTAPKINKNLVKQISPHGIDNTTIKEEPGQNSQIAGPSTRVAVGIRMNGTQSAGHGSDTFGVSPPQAHDTLTQVVPIMGFQSGAQQLEQGQQQQQEEQFNVPTELVVYPESNGFTIHIPPCPTPTILYVRPDTWSAFKHHPTTAGQAQAPPSTTATFDFEARNANNFQSQEHGG